MQLTLIACVGRNIKVYLSSGLVNTNDLAGKRITGNNRCMNTVGLPDKVHIEGTGDDAGVPGMLLMQTDKIAAVEGQHGPLLRRGESQNGRVGNRLTGVTTILDGQHLMPQLT